MSEAGRKLGACGVLRVAACVRWPRRGPAVGVQCKSGQAALAINIATTSLQCINESTKRAEPPALAALAAVRGKGRGGVVQVTRVQQGVCVVRRLPVTLRHSRTTRSISM